MDTNPDTPQNNSIINTAAEADARAKQLVKPVGGAQPCVTGGPSVVEGTHIKYWHVLWVAADRPDDEPKPLMGGNTTTVIADNGKAITIDIGQPFGNTPKPSFSQQFLKQY